jgi:hypothetical protein
MGSIINRLLTIMGGYCLASLAAGYALSLGYMLLMLFAVPPSQGLQASMLGIMFAMGGLYAAALVAALALLPATLVIACAEAARLRSAAVYGVAGAVTAILCLVVALLASGRASPGAVLPGPAFGTGPVLTPGQALDTGAIALYFAAAGLLSGLVYWRTAGRTAGAWRVFQGALP